MTTGVEQFGEILAAAGIKRPYGWRRLSFQRADLRDRQDD
jgi:hypothetical protein